MIVDDDDDDDDCQKLNEITDDPITKTRLNQLRIEGNSFEKGFRLDKNPSNNQYQPTPLLESASGTNHINLRVNAYTAVAAHSHTDNVFYKMFSGKDILQMGLIGHYINNTADTTLQPLEITMMLVFEFSTGADKAFALRFDDIESFNNLVSIRNDKLKRDEFDDDLEEAYNEDYDPITNLSNTDIYKQQRHIFNLLENYNLNISLYEANFDSNGLVDNWQKINKNSLDKEPCN